MGFTWCKDHEIFWLCIFFFPHGTPRVSSGYLESSWEKEKKKKKRAVISKNLILTFVVGITFLEKPHFAARHKIMLYNATSKYTMNLS
jgi:hypothetical protein